VSSKKYVLIAPVHSLTNFVRGACTELVLVHIFYQLHLDQSEIALKASQARTLCVPSRKRKPPDLVAHTRHPILGYLPPGLVDWDTCAARGGVVGPRPHVPPPTAADARRRPHYLHRLSNVGFWV